MAFFSIYKYKFDKNSLNDIICKAKGDIMKNKNSKKEIRIELDEIEANNEYKKTDYIDLKNISCDD